MHGHGELDYYDSIGIFTLVHLSQLLGLFVVICHEVNTQGQDGATPRLQKGVAKCFILFFLVSTPTTFWRQISNATDSSRFCAHHPPSITVKAGLTVYLVAVV